MRLAEFILANIEPILAEWEAFARSLSPGATMTIVALRDDAESILLATARDMQNRQSLQQQASKSKGHGGAGGTASDRLDNASDLHGVDRVGWGFHITEVVSEYRALRASVLRLWRESLPQPDLNDIDDITRFNESLDQSLARGVHSYSKRIDESRQMFLAILSHDLRNPLGAVTASAALLAVPEDNPERRGRVVTRIMNSAQRMERMIGDLLDLTRARFGGSMPLKRRSADLRQVCEEAMIEIRAGRPEAVLRFQASGDLRGGWDVDRLAQVVSNLVGNAIQHGSGAPVTLNGQEQGDAVTLAVHNGGPPIPPEVLPFVFEPLARGRAEGASQSIGLGLFIARVIVSAHGGHIQVSSSTDAGTTVTVVLPKVS